MVSCKLLCLALALVVAVSNAFVMRTALQSPQLTTRQNMQMTANKHVAAAAVASAAWTTSGAAVHAAGKSYVKISLIAMPNTAVKSEIVSPASSISQRCTIQCNAASVCLTKVLQSTASLHKLDNQLVLLRKHIAMRFDTCFNISLELKFRYPIIWFNDTISHAFCVICRCNKSLAAGWRHSRHCYRSGQQPCSASSSCSPWFYCCQRSGRPYLLLVSAC
jgi:hypothetical protein